MIESFLASGFRNLAPQTVAFGSGASLLVGANGAGKTSVLEALAQLSGRPSFRGASPAEMAAGDGFVVRGAASLSDYREELEASWLAGRGRRYSRSGKAVSYSVMGEVFPAIFFSPDDRALIVGSPATRRRFLDRISITLHPASADDFSRFARILLERNALLASGSADRESLLSWTDEFVSASARVLVRRREAVARWEAEFRHLVETAGATLAGLTVSYSGTEVPDTEAESFYREESRRLAQAESRRGRTLFGPQRDDLVFSRDERPFAASASSGETARAAYLARLAEAAVTARGRGEEPLYAIDEFDAHLAPSASEELLSLLPEEAQILLTSARPDAAALCPRPPAAIFQVAEGRLAEITSPARLRRIG